jgi:DNA polymerase-3 subunit alpha
MKHSDFVHLHNHSDYSLLDGASPIAGMVRRAAELQMPALALTDHGAMFGAVEFYQEARKAGVKPLVGMEAYVTRGRLTDREAGDTAHHLVLLARDERGFRNLMRLASLAYLEGFYYKPRVDHDVLAAHAAGLLALSACPKGEVASDLLAGDEQRALETAGLYRDMFGADHYFLEIQNHGLEIEDRIRAGVTALAARTGIPLVATNDCHYLEPGHDEAQDVLLCIQTGRTVADEKRMKATAGLHFASPEEMKRAFADHPEAVRNTLAVAERCNLKLDFGRPLLPEFPLPAGEPDTEAYFRRLAWAALGDRFGGAVSESLRERFQYELDVICKMGFASYFLIVRDFIHFAKSRGIGVGPGRGSVAGSLVAYALRITEVDPIRHQLIFERFLNPERVTMPDIDIDFDDIRRGEVIDYVKSKYGEHNVTQIITFGTMGAKGVLRDVGRALGLPVGEVDRLAKLVPDGLGVTLDKAIEQTPDLKSLPQKGPVYAKLMRTARVLEGLARHSSVHAAGVLITPGPLTDYVPLCKQKGELVTTQWDMKAVEKAGLLKMDFLGLRTLSVLQECVDLVRQRDASAPALADLPEGDPRAYQVFQDAETVGIFQFESAGMRDYLKRLKPTVFEDLVAMNALYRPGPMENIPYFIDCKHGRQKVKYEHPKLEPILRGTYGVFVYQEQVMAAAHELAGFSMAQADELRRAMGKKIAEEMAKKREQFIEGCARTSRIAERVADRIFATMEKFAGYGFNKCLTGDTEIHDALTGERTTIQDLFRHRRPFTIHALDDRMRLVPRRVDDVVWNGRRPVFELRTARGRRLRATANHPLRTLDGWTRVEELEVGDRIAAARRVSTASDRSWPRHELIVLAGLIAEGNTCHPSTLYFHGNDREVVEDFREAVAEFPDTTSRIDSRGDGGLEVVAILGCPERIHGGVAAYAAAQGNLAVVLEAPGRRSGALRWAERLGIIGKRATQKRIPGEVFTLNEASVELFLGRLWTGDGYLSGVGRHAPYYATSSRDLATDVQSLLLRVGILSTVHSKRFRYRGTTRPGFTVHLVGDEAIETFIDRIVPHVVGRSEAKLGLKRRGSTTRRDRSSRDTVPGGVREWVREERIRAGLTWAELEARSGVSMKEFTGRGSSRKRGFRRSTLARLATFFGSMRLARLATSDVHWDTITAITPCGVEDTFDLTIERDHNFVANGLVVHNSHSAAYALVAYQCAYLKGNHPAEFMAATLTSEMGDSDRVLTLVEECRRLGLELLPPDVNRSQWRFTLEDGRVRVGLGAVRNVGRGAVDALVRAREAGGAFRDLFDLASRLPAGAANRRVVESLVAAGACDALGGARSRLHAGAAGALEHAAALHRERSSGQSSLFGEEDSGLGVAVAPPLPDVPDWPPRERGAREKEVLGFYFSGHPLDHLRAEIEQVASHGIAQALELGDGAEARVVGVVGEVKQLTTRAGKLMALVTLEDLTGRVECTVFPEAYEQARATLVSEAVVVASGRVEIRDERGAKLLLQDVRPWDEARRQHRSVLHIELRAEDLSEERLADMDEVLSSFPGDSEVVLHIVKPDHSRMAMRSRRFRVRAHDGLIAELKARVPTCRVRWGRGSA